MGARLIMDHEVHNHPGYGQIPDEAVHNHPDGSHRNTAAKLGLYHNEHTGRRVKINGHTGTQIGMHPDSHKPYIDWDEDGK